jgi:hypothetical protein
MKLSLSILILIVSFSASSTDFNPTGTWQGVVIQKGTTIEKGVLFYAEFNLSDGYVSGLITPLKP